MKFYEKLERFYDNPALISNGEILTYQKLAEEVQLLKGWCTKRQLAFCVCTNTIASVEGYLAFLQAGIPVVLLSPNTDHSMAERLFSLYCPYYLWAPKGYRSDDSVYQHRGYEMILYSENWERELVHKDLAVLLTTSGSTGSPKLVRQSYQNIIANSNSIVQYLGIVSSDRVITSLPMHYTYGLSIIQSHLLCGAAIVLTDDVVISPEFWNLIREYQVTTFGGVPYTYEMLDKIHFLNRDVFTLRYLTQAGGRLGRELHLKLAAECAKKGIDFIVMYGQTEATARMSYVPAQKAVEKAGSIGVAIPGGKFGLVDADDREIQESNVVGELIYQGANVTMGYAESREDLSKESDWGGVLHTGDMACRDEDGYYYIKGRKKRFLKLYGNRVNLDEVENLLNQNQISCAVSGQDDHMRIYVTNEEDRTSAKSYIAQRTKIPRFGYEIIKISEIPRNDSGKILYAVLEKET